MTITPVNEQVNRQNVRVPFELRYGIASGIEFRTLTARDKRFLKRAVTFARKRDVDYQNHCAIAARGPKIVAIGFNAYKNDPRSLSEEHLRVVPGMNQRNGVGSHAEVAALMQLNDTDGVSIYVARVTKDGEIANSAPCEGCIEAVRIAGVKRIVWSEDGMIL